jgi:tellurite resistance protein TerC
VLVFVGSKMVLVEFYKIPVGVSLAVVGTVLAASVLVSLLIPERRPGDRLAEGRGGD